ncbi:Benzoate 4-monooxygenase [Grifola frondosa]|uniref:Benzoate 4-monooxygenase n=1 Tax=Grifola frondosa TaxID=5627 RepID=A0A1C7MRC6_GRIFR|nr:Benzoate 4-monooxygenase [Grifola frondosa]
MSLLQALPSPDISSAVILCVVVVSLAHLVPYFVDPHGIHSYPGPFLAKFSDIWLGWTAAQGHRSERVHELHKKYGTFVRIAPNHLSISDPDALQVVYAHGNGTLKSEFYDAFVSIQRGLFNTRSRPDHARKRKIVSHIFSQKSVLEFEPNIRLHLTTLFKQWDRLCEGGLKSLSGDEGEGGWKGRDGRVWFDCLPWYNYLAFDIIGDLAFGAPFGMLIACKDSAPVATSQKDAIASYGQECKSKFDYFPAVQRFNTPTDRADLLGKLQEGRDEEGRPMGREELTAEALTQLIAGSDTTSNSSCALTYHLARNQDVQEKLQRELDDELGGEDDPVPTYEQVKRLPYLEAVINEALRIHSTSGIGLPRLVPAGGLIVCGREFPEGTVLSVPTYTIHRDPAIWGEDTEAFRPERWFEADKVAVQKTFNPFSFGPRSCVGRNLASLELLVIVASIFRRYHFVLEDPNADLETREGFLRKPLECRVGMMRRNV